MAPENCLQKPPGDTVNTIRKKLTPHSAFLAHVRGFYFGRIARPISSIKCATEASTPQLHTRDTMDTIISANYSNYRRFANLADAAGMPQLVSEPDATVVVTAEEYENDSPLVCRKRVCFGKEIGLDESIDVSFWSARVGVSSV